MMSTLRDVTPSLRVWVAYKRYVICLSSQSPGGIGCGSPYVHWQPPANLNTVVISKNGHWIDCWKRGKMADLPYKHVESYY
jgi:hypothetical protein